MSPLRIGSSPPRGSLSCLRPMLHSTRPKAAPSWHRETDAEHIVLSDGASFQVCVSLEHRAGFKWAQASAPPPRLCLDLKASALGASASSTGGARAGPPAALQGVCTASVLTGKGAASSWLPAEEPTQVLFKQISLSLLKPPASGSAQCTSCHHGLLPSEHR